MAGCSGSKANQGSKIRDMVAKMCAVDDLMKKSVLKPGIEKEMSVPTIRQSRLQLKKKSRLERNKTKGKMWYDLPMTEMTEEVKNDLSILQMRSALDKKHFYKANDLKVLPKYFQVGTVLDSAADRYNSLPKKQRKRTLVEELLADADFRKSNKKQYSAIQESQSKGASYGKRRRKMSKSKLNKLNE